MSELERLKEENEKLKGEVKNLKQLNTRYKNQLEQANKDHDIFNESDAKTYREIAQKLRIKLNQLRTALELEREKNKMLRLQLDREKEKNRKK